MAASVKRAPISRPGPRRSRARTMSSRSEMRLGMYHSATWPASSCSTTAGGDDGSCEDGEPTAGGAASRAGIAQPASSKAQHTDTTGNFIEQPPEGERVVGARLAARCSKRWTEDAPSEPFGERRALVRTFV